LMDLFTVSKKSSGVAVRGNERGGHRQYASARGMRPDGTESTLSHGDRGFESRFPASWSSRSSPPRDGAPHRRRCCCRGPSRDRGQGHRTPRATAANEPGVVVVVGFWPGPESVNHSRLQRQSSEGFCAR
jgi:hypothetical protein